MEEEASRRRQIPRSKARVGLRTRAKVALTGFVLVAGILGGLTWVIPEVSAYSPHDPISIMSDGEFTLANGVVGGTGTVGDPYLIQGWEIASDVRDGIHISGTNAYFVIDNVFVHGDYSNYGIHISGSVNGTVQNSMLMANYAGVYLDTTRRMTVQTNSISWNYYGVETYSVTDLHVLGNMIDANDNAIYADYGLTNFTCISNSMDGSNYDAIDVYGNVKNAVIEDCTMRLANYGWGINVDGGAFSVEIISCNITGNFYGGMFFSYACDKLHVSKCWLTENGDHGIYMEYGGNNCSVDNCEIASNDYSGVYFGSGGYYGGSSIESNRITGNDGYGIHCEGLNTVISDNIVDSQTDGGGIFVQNDDIRVENNTVADNAGYGIHVSSGSARARVANNTLVKCGVFVDFAYSPEVTLSDNLVNDLPLLFLNDVSGASVSSGVGQVIALDSDNLYISDLDLSSATVGVELWNTDSSVIDRITANYGAFGVFIKNYSREVHVQESDLSLNGYGAWISQGCQQVSVIDCNLSDSRYIGAEIEWCTEVSVEGNRITDCDTGVQSVDSEGIVITKNNISRSMYVSVYAVAAIGLEVSGNEIFGSQNGIIMYSAVASTVSWNRVVDCVYRGIGIYYGTDNRVDNNTLSLCMDGVYIEGGAFQYSMRGVVRDNQIEGNSRYGVFMNYAEANTICWNNITDNAWGIYISGTHTPRNWIYLNNFDNTINAYSGWSGNGNYWNTSTMVEYWWGGVLHTGYLGNYWADYAGVDGDNNGVGDTPYTFTGEQDNYPLMDESWALIPEYENLVLPALTLLCMLFVLARAPRPRRGR